MSLDFILYLSNSLTHQNKNKTIFTKIVRNHNAYFLVMMAGFYQLERGVYDFINFSKKISRYFKKFCVKKFSIFNRHYKAVPDLPNRNYKRRR